MTRRNGVIDSITRPCASSFSQTDVEDEPVFLDAEHEIVGPARRALRREMIGFQKIVDRDLALLLDLACATDDGLFVERNLDDAKAPVMRRCSRSSCLDRAAMERAWASRPSLSARVIASGPSAAMASGVHDSSVVRFRKSSTERPDENRAVRAVGST